MAFLEFLQNRLKDARLDFLEAKRQLEDFEMEHGSLAYLDAWERQDQALSDQAHLAYEAYKKAWVEWYAAANGHSLHPERGQKDTPAFAAPVSANYLRERIET